VKKTILIIAGVLSFSSAAFSGAYTDAADKQIECNNWGEVARNVYKDLDTPEGRIRSENYYDKVSDSMENVKNGDKFSKLSEKRKYLFAIALRKSMAASYAIHDAKTGQDAYIHAWGLCMDTIK